MPRYWVIAPYENQELFDSDVGPIDILAVEADSNSFVIIKLKKARTSDQVVGQILRYMGWVKKNLCKDGQGVKGIVICREADERFSYAARYDERARNRDQVLRGQVLAGRGSDTTVQRGSIMSPEDRAAYRIITSSGTTIRA